MEVNFDPPYFASEEEIFAPDASSIQNSKILSLSPLAKNVWSQQEIESDLLKDLPTLLQRFDEISLLSIQIPSDDLFYETDLRIYKDDYTGHLPLNGIRQSEFEEIKQAYQDIVQEKTLFKVHNFQDNFSEAIFDCFKILLTRQVGRDLILQLVNHTSHRSIIIKPGFEWKVENMDQKEFFLVEKDFKTSANFNDSTIVQVLNPKTDEKTADSTPNSLKYAIYLGHELIHVLNGFSITSIQNKWHTAPPTISLLDDMALLALLTN